MESDVHSFDCDMNEESFNILRIIGKGGCATVYLIKHKKSSRFFSFQGSFFIC